MTKTADLEAAGTTAKRSRSAPGVVLAVLAFASLGAAFMQTILIPIQQELPQLLNASASDTAWAITATLVAATISAPLAGRLGDMFGARRIAMGLLLLQAAGALIAAMSETLTPLIIARVLQGMAAGLIPLSISILREVMPAQRLGSAVALVSATLGIGAALGLPISAVVAENYDWHMLFWVAAGIAILAFVLFALVVPASSTSTRGRLDVPGIIGLAVSVTAILIAVSRGGEWGWTDPRTLGLLIGGVVVLLIWGVIELRVKDPIVDLRVTAKAPVLLTNLAAVAMGFALFASNVVFPQLLALPAATGIGLGLSLVAASLILAPSGIAMMMAAPVAGRLEKQRGPRSLLVLGSAIIALSYGGALLFHATAWQLLIVNIVLGIGIGLGYAAMPSILMQAVPASETGAANGVNALMRSLGTSIAAAVIGAVLAQSVTSSNGIVAPSESGFVISLALGLVAAVVALVLALLIPRPKRQDA